MDNAKKVVMACAAAAMGLGAIPGRPLLLEGQVIRCYDVTCTTDVKTGVVRCVEKLTVCPP